MQESRFRSAPFFYLSLGFLAILIVVFRDFVFHPDTLMLNSDQLNGLGSRYLRVRSFLLTLWDSSRLGGVPTLDALFGDAYHPLVLIQWLTDPARAVGFKFIAIVWVAFLSGLVLFRHLSSSWSWGGLLAFLYAFNPQFFTHVYGGHDGKMMVFSIAPLAIYGLLRILRDGRWSGTIILSLSLVWMLLSSHLQLTYFFLWGAGLFALYLAYLAPSRPTPAKASLRLGMAALALAAGLAMGSIQVIPPYKYTTQESVRGTGEKTTYGHATSWSLHPEEMASMVLPGFIGTDVGQERGYWGRNSFKLNHDAPGVLLMLFASVGLFLRKERRQAFFWLCGSVIALSYALGAHSLLFHAYYDYLPGVKNFRAPSMAIFWIPLAMAILAARVLPEIRKPENQGALISGLGFLGLLIAMVFGMRMIWESMLGPFGVILALVPAAYLLGAWSVLDQGKELSFSGIFAALKQGLPGTPRWKQAVAALPFLLVGSFLAFGADIHANSETSGYFGDINQSLMSAGTGSAVASFAVLAIVLGAAWYAMISRSWSVVVVTAVLGAAASLDLFVVDHPFIQTVPRSQYYQPDNPILSAIRKDSPDSLNRPMVLSVSRNPALSGNIFPAYGMDNALGFHDNEIASYRDFRGGPSSENYLRNAPSNPFLDLAAVGYLIYDTPQGTRAMRNPTVLPKARLYAMQRVEEKEQMNGELTAGHFPHATVALLEESAGLPDWNPSDTVPPLAIHGMARIVDGAEGDHQVIEVTADAPALLVVAGNWLPSWKATVNGVAAKTTRAFGTFRAVAVPQGKSKVEWKYQSAAIEQSLQFGIGGAGLLVILIGLSLWQSRKQKNVPETETK